jgi:tetratricopeptide (TPR) repeat protein
MRRYTAKLSLRWFRRRSRFRFLSLASLVFAVASSAFPLNADGPAQLKSNSTIGQHRPEATVNPCAQGKQLVVTVLDDKKALLDRQAVVKLHDQKTDSETWQTTSDESALTFCNVEYGNYDVEATAVGYLTGRKDLQLTNIPESVRLEILLRKDPSAVDIGGSVDSIPAAERKDSNRAVYELKSGNLKEAEKRLDRIYKAAPLNAQVNFLYGYLYLQLNDLEKSESYLTQAAKLNPQRVQTLSLLGRVQLQRQHYDDAQKTLEQAVMVDPGFWMAHNLLADAYLRQKEYEKARLQAQAALEEGKGSASVAQLILGQALLETGNTNDGLQSLEAFLQSNPDNPAKPQVQALIAKAETAKAGIAKTETPKTETANAETRDSASATTGATTAGVRDDLALAAAPPTLTTNSWGPPGVDDVKPWIAAGVACPTQEVIDRSGERMKELVDNITRFAAIESLVHERLDLAGNPTSKETRKFDYVASINDRKAGFLQTEEYRDSRYGVYDLPDNIVTVGFVTQALIFHPAMRDSFEMTCEGLGQWHGQPTWLMHFRQRDDKPNRFADYKIAKQTYPMKLKGRAWIAADNFQIVRIESDLVNPLPLLTVQHQIAEYGPVHFTKKNVDLWLPQTVDIYLELNRHHYHRRHSFEHYMLFSVDSQDKSLTENKADKPTKNP